MNLQQAELDDICFEKEDAPVVVDVLYNNHCVDLRGKPFLLATLGETSL